MNLGLGWPHSLGSTLTLHGLLIRLISAWFLLLPSTLVTLLLPSSTRAGAYFEDGFLGLSQAELREKLGAPSAVRDRKAALRVFNYYSFGLGELLQEADLAAKWRGRLHVQARRSRRAVLIWLCSGPERHLGTSGPLRQSGGHRVLALSSHRTDHLAGPRVPAAHGTDSPGVPIEPLG